MVSCMRRRARREWLDAICRLIIWTTLSSQTSIPRDPLTTISYYNTNTLQYTNTHKYKYTYSPPRDSLTTTSNYNTQITKLLPSYIPRTIFHLTSYYRHTRSRPNAMLDQIGRLLYQRQLLSFEFQCTQGSYCTSRRSWGRIPGRR